MQIAKLAPSAMVHGRQDMPVALFKPQWKQLLPHMNPAAATAQQQQQRKAPQKPLWLRIEEQIAHSMDGWKVYFRWGQDPLCGCIGTGCHHACFHSCYSMPPHGQTGESLSAASGHSPPCVLALGTEARASHAAAQLCQQPSTALFSF